MNRLWVPLGGFGAIVGLATVLIGGIVLRSPDTHANLWTTLKPDYTRTSVSFVGEKIGDIELALDVRQAGFSNLGPMSSGRAAYLTRGCSTCHGLNAMGGLVGPSLAGSLPEVVKRMVRNGPGGMPAFGENHLSDADLADLSIYLRSLEIVRPDSIEIAEVQHLTYDPLVPIDVLLKGKTAIRRSCGACHTQPGDVDILRAFNNDADAAILVADMVPEANLSLEDAKAIAYYMLAVIHNDGPLKSP